MNWQDLQHALTSGAALQLVDVRTPAEFASEHLAGSVSLPLDRIDAAAAARLAAGGRCVLICGSGKRASQAHAQLAAAGCTTTEVLDGGIQAWLAAGQPVERGRRTISLERQVRIGTGLLVLTGAALATWVHPAWLLLSAGVGLGLTIAGITDWCGMALLLARMPWNQRA